MSADIQVTANGTTVSASSSGASVSVADHGVSIAVTGGVGPKGEDGGAGVSSVNGLTGGLTLAAVGATLATAGNTITITVAPGVSSWNDLTGKPSTFAPSAHASSHDALGSDPVTLAIGQVNGLQTALDGKQAAGSYVLTTDSRLTDSREWSAATVTQAQAEAGTDTARLAFTVQRVWQAIAAWWAASSAKTKLDGIASGATANQTDAYLLSRANHTGTQAVGTITGLGGAAALSVGTTAGTVAAGDDSRITGALSTATAATSYQPLDADLTSIAALTTTTFGRSLLTQADAAATRTTIGLGSLATQSGTFSGTSSGTNTGDQTITLTGDATGSGTGSFAVTLASSGVTAGTYTSVTVDAKGRVTAGSSPAIAYSAITATPTTLSGYGITDAATSTHTHGNITSAGAIGSTSGQIVVTTTSGVVTTATIGSGLSLSGGILTSSGGSLTYTSGSAAPSNATGSNGDLYLRYP
jgi:hypothetical protein